MGFVARGTALVALALMLPSPAGAEAGCTLQLTSPSPVTLAAAEPVDIEGEGETEGEDVVEGIVRWEGGVVISTSCPTDTLTFDSDVEGLEIEMSDGDDGPLVQVDLAVDATTDDETIEGHLVVASEGGPVLDIPIGVAEPKSPKVEILNDSLTARFAVDDATTALHLSVKVSDADLATDGLGAIVYLTDGGTAVASDVNSGGVTTIAQDQTAELTLEFDPNLLKGGGGVLSLTRTVGDATTSLATHDLAVARQVSPQQAWMIVLGPLALALATIGFGALVIRGQRNAYQAQLAQKIAEVEAQLANAAEPKKAELQKEVDGLKERKTEDAADVLPKRAEWKFSDGWAGSLTAFGATVASVLAATGLLGEYLPGLATGPFIAANLTFIALVTSAPMTYNAAGRFTHGNQLGTFGGLYLAGVLSLWGVYGFLGLIAALVSHLDSPTAEAFVIVMVLLAIGGVAVYAVRTMVGRAQQPEPDKPATPTVVNVEVSLRDLAAAASQRMGDLAPEPKVTAAMADLQTLVESDDVGMETVSVPLLQPGPTPSLLAAHFAPDSAPDPGRDSWAVF